LARVELQLQLCDGKIPFTLPWLDAAERHLWSLLHNACTVLKYLEKVRLKERKIWAEQQFDFGVQS
jgi:hypothetical protein